MTDTIVERVWSILSDHGFVTENGEWLACSREEFERAITEHRNAMSEGVGELVERLQIVSRSLFHATAASNGSRATVHLMRARQATAAINDAAAALTTLQARLAEQERELLALRSRDEGWRLQSEEQEARLAELEGLLWREAVFAGHCRS
jgi:chromosome segregation ATPase